MNIFDPQAPKKRNPADEIVASIQGVVDAGKKGDYFDDKQLKQESGGRQLDASGKPLVGRHPDGSLPPVAKRAYGAGQMQIGTAKNTAAQFGIPWDESKFMTDKDYNLRLADAHMEHLTKKYGDRRLALAGYHQGEPTVDKAIAKYGREGALKGQGIGPVGRKYMGLGSNSGGSASGGGSTGVTQMMEVDDIRAVKATASESAALKNGRQYEVVDPFTQGENARGSAAKIENRAATLDETISSAIDETNRLQAEQAAALEQRNSIRAGAREDIRAGTQQMLAIAKPIFQKKEAIANRIGEIADMGPLERMIKGTFDPNYNLDTLRAKDGLYAEQLSKLSEAYDYTAKLQSNLIASAAESYSDQSDVFALRGTHAAQDIQLLGQSLAAAEGELSRVVTNLGVDSAIERSKQFAIADTVTNLTPGQLNEAAQSAVDGFTMINGIRVPVSMVDERLNNLQEIEYAMASRELAFQSQNMALVEQSENRAIGFMSQAEIESAIENNGVFQGQQLPMDKLVTQQVNLAQGREVAAQQLQVTQSTQVFHDVSKMIGSRAQVINARAASLGGGGDPKALELNNSITAEFTRLTEGLRAAEKKGIKNEYAASVLPRLEQLTKMQDEYVSGFVKTWSAGNKDLAAVGNAWMTGQSLNTRAAARGLIVLARDGLPSGTNLQGPALTAFRAAQAELKVVASPIANTAVFAAMDDSRSKPKDGITDEMIERVMSKAGEAYANDLSDRAIRSLPQLARTVKGADGQPHPFSKVDPRDYADSLQLGDEEGFARVGQDMGLKGDAVKNLFGQSPTSQSWTSFLGGREGREATFEYWAGRLLTMQTQSMLKHLDLSPSAQNGFREGFKPSDALASLLSDPQLRTQVGKEMKQRGQSSLGDFVVGATGGSAAVDSFLSYADSVPSAQRARRQQALSDVSRSANELLSNPVKRFEYIVSALPGITDAEQRTLVAATREAIGYNGVMQARNAVGRAVSFGMAGEDFDSKRFDAFIRNGKFDDPQVEAIRKRAAKNWDNVVPQVESVVNKIYGTDTHSMVNNSVRK